MGKRQIVNIVNFIREIEPRLEVDLLRPVQEQIRLMQENHLRGTFLLQYDALLDERYLTMLRALDPEQFEFGVWLEIVEPQTEAAGIAWRGKYPWDWHAYCGFSVGYDRAQREKLIDVLFERFKGVFGYYPRVLGSWFYDTHSIRYAAQRYGLDAVCNCKEQYGTDGYTLWGGYYGQAYYPSRDNVFMPAQTREKQMDVPLFRMLGSDPVDQYDVGLSLDAGADPVQHVITLEPVYVAGGGGGNPQWVDWYMRENFNGDCLSFGYAQAGQENSFGWPAMGAGLEYQFRRFAELQAQGKISVEPMGQTGRWFQTQYSQTPASAIVAHTAFDDPARNSVWYSSRFYRVNLYGDHGTLRMRDLHVFKETMPDPFEDAVCTTNDVTYETLPVADGNRYTGRGVLAGVYFTGTKAPIPPFSEMKFTDLGHGAARVQYGSITILLREDALRVECDQPFTLENRMGNPDEHYPQIVRRDAQEMVLIYNGVPYSLRLTEGRFTGALTAAAETGVFEVHFG